MYKECKVYSSQTCCLVPERLNTIISSLNVKREKHSDLPSAVYRSDSKIERYCSYIQYSRYERVCLGTFDTPMEAFEVYKKAKESQIKQLAKMFYDEGAILEDVYQEIMKIDIRPFY